MPTTEAATTETAEGMTEGDSFMQRCWRAALSAICATAMGLTAVSHAQVPPLDLGDLPSDGPVVFNGPGSQAQMGAAVVGIGDLNGDGLGDFALAAPNASIGDHESAGVVYVIFGDANANLPALNQLNGTNGFRITGNAQGQRLGFSIAEAGDFNADGFSDLAISTSPNDGAAAEAFVLYGKAESFAENVNVQGITEADGFRLFSNDALTYGSRWVVGTAADLNNDGAADLIVGAADASPAGTAESGSGFVVFGSPSPAATLNAADLNATNGFRLDGASLVGNAGWSVSGTPDLDGDGIDDLLIGAPNDGQAGAAYLFYGKNTAFSAVYDLSALGTNGHAFTGEDAGDGFGYAVSSAGDMNADGLADIAIGAPAASPGGFLSGQTALFYGAARSALPAAPADLTGTNGVRIDGAFTGDFSGSTIGSAGDVNIDGYDDLFVGAQQAGTFAGAAFLVFGGPDLNHLALDDLDGSNGVRIDGSSPGDLAGASLSSLPDADGDGYRDLLLGAPGAFVGSLRTGKAYFLSGKLFFNPPPIGVELSNNSVLENQPMGLYIGKLLPIDPSVYETEYDFRLVNTENFPDNDLFFIQGDSLFSGATFDYESQQQYQIMVRVLDLAGQAARSSFQIDVLNANEPPVLSPISDYNLDEFDTLRFQVSAYDTDLAPNNLSFSVNNQAAGLGVSIDSLTGEVEWPTNELRGGRSFTFTIRVTDDGEPAAFDLQTFNVSVNEINSPPSMLLRGDQEVYEGDELIIETETIDLDVPVNTLSYRLDPSSAAMGVSVNSFGVVRWTPSEEAGGNAYSITAIVDDNGAPNLSDSISFNVRVLETNTPPIITGIADTLVREKEYFAQRFYATDIDVPAQNVRFSVDEASAEKGISIDPETGILEWTPSEAQDGLAEIIIRATDDGETPTTTEFAFLMTVREVNSAPVLRSSPALEAVEHEPLVYQFIADDEDLPANELRFTLDEEAVRRGLDLDPLTGLLEWTPAESDGQSAFTAILTVTDGDTLDVDTLSFSVEETNTIPYDLQLSNDHVRENEQAGSFVGVFTVSDGDENEFHTYLLANGPGSEGNDFFTVRADSLFTNEYFDHERQPTYDIRVRVEDAQRASNARVFRITVENIEEPCDVSQNVLQVAPNPVTSAFRVSFRNGESDAVSVRIFSLDGKQVFAQTFNKPDDCFRATLNADHLRQGLYLVEVRSASQRLVSKFLKQ